MITLGSAPRRTPRLTDLLSPAELAAAVLDGELHRLGDDIAAIDLPITTERRAQALASTIADRRVIVSDRSAAWVWGWLPLMPPLSTSVDITARVASPVRRQLRAREVVIDADETTAIASLLVTNPLRTLVDLARHDPAPDVIDLLARGMLESRIRAESVHEALARRPRLAYVRRARQRIADATSVAARSVAAGTPGSAGDLSRC